MQFNQCNFIAEIQTETDASQMADSKPASVSPQKTSISIKHSIPQKLNMLNFHLNQIFGKSENDPRFRKRESEGKPGMQDTQAPLQTCEPEKKKNHSVQKKQLPKEQRWEGCKQKFTHGPSRRAVVSSKLGQYVANQISGTYACREMGVLEFNVDIQVFCYCFTDYKDKICLFSVRLLS